MSRFAGLSLALSVVCLSGCSTPQESRTSATEAAPGVVATFPAGTGLSFGLAPGPCAAGKCAAVVQLLKSGKVIDSSPLDFAASAAPLNQGSADKIMGAGDPLAESDTLPAWTAGDGEDTVTTAARSMTLSPDQPALLVDQSGGFQHVKRRHYLFVADDNAIKRVWTGEEGAGPAWSAAVVVDAADGHGQELVYLTGFQPGGPGPDTVNARRYRWDVVQRALIERTLGSLYAVVAGNFANPDAARAAGAQTCLADYSALSGRDLGITGVGVVLAAITTQRSLAEAALNKADNCPAGVGRRLVEVKLATDPTAKN